MLAKRDSKVVFSIKFGMMRDESIPTIKTISDVALNNIYLDLTISFLLRGKLLQ